MEISPADGQPRAGDLAVIIAARVPLVVVETHDEKSTLELLQRVAREHDRALFRWTVTDGLQAARFGLQVEQENQHCAPEAVLEHIKSRGQPGVYMLCDLHPWLADSAKIIRLIKDIALKHEHGSITLVLVSHRLDLPPELGRFAVRFNLDLPTEREILSLVKEEARKWGAHNQGQKVRADSVALHKLATALKGLSQGEVKRLARTAIYDDGAISDGDLPDINRAKFQLLGMDGVVSYSFQAENIDDLGGMENLKAWLALRQKVFSDSRGADVADSPRGILLLGVQGGGKSLAAKAVAGMWQLPMLRLDMGALYNKYHGETERNLREALALADRMAPCVLWVDEIEKAISAGDSDGGVSQRVLGTLLTWMQEHDSRVFMVATANDISRLPPELMRKGRFDEIFFVDLPGETTRRTIFAIHLRKRNLDPEVFSLEQLSAATEGFSGAEIEQAVVSALYSASAGEGQVDTGAILDEVMATSPLSELMAEKLSQLRNWAAQRNLRTV